MKKIILLAFFVSLLPNLALAALININTASSVELEKITGVGTVIAGLIVDYRNANGPFKTIEEIKNVNRIGDATFLKMKSEITVDSNDVPIEPAINSDLTNSGNSDNNVSRDSSVHTGETDLSDYQNESFKIGAGRERLATVRTPILFSASQNKKGKDVNYFVWSFGDGTNATGAKVYHTYQFPGHYNVVLNGLIDSGEGAVARTAVLVTEPEIKITAVDPAIGYVEITNNGDEEQNLNSWALRAVKNEYTFPLDTIVSPKAAIKVPLKVLGLVDQNIQEITLVYPDGGVASGASLQNDQNQLLIADLKKQLAKMKWQLAENSNNIDTLRANPQRSLVSKPNHVVVLAKKLGWFEKIKNALFK
ncbi:MAG: helix-hairpin-helix domain-containing protein [Candidatus Paceibacterota bacterium]